MIFVKNSRGGREVNMINTAYIILARSLICMINVIKTQIISIAENNKTDDDILSKKLHKTLIIFI